MRPKTILNGYDNEAIKTLINIHSSVENPKILDCTYNKGVMWKNTDYKPIRMDIDPSLPNIDVVADFKKMPFEDKSFDIIVFDPPHLPSDIGCSSVYKEMYNTDKFDEGRERYNISSVFKSFLTEAKRVLVKNGIILAKLADLVHSHIYQWQQVDFVNAVREINMMPCDMLIKCDPRAGRMESGIWKNVYHLRKAHSYWLVVRNSKRCERLH